MITIRPSDIYFSQDSIKPSFDSKGIHGNKLIGETLDDICEGRCSVHDIPTISVLKKDGKWVSADNRRLWILRELERLDRVDYVRVKITNYINPDKLTSTNGGDSIHVRGNPGGQWRHKGRNRSRGGKRNRSKNRQRNRARSQSPVSYQGNVQQQKSRSSSNVRQTKQPTLNSYNGPTLINTGASNYANAYTSPTTYNNFASINSTKYTSPTTYNTGASNNSKQYTSPSVYNTRAASNNSTGYTVPTTYNTGASNSYSAASNNSTGYTIPTTYNTSAASNNSTGYTIPTTYNTGASNSYRNSGTNTNQSPSTKADGNNHSTSSRTSFDSPVTATRQPAPGVWGTSDRVQPVPRAAVYTPYNSPKESRGCLTSLLRILCCCCLCDSD